MSAAAIKTLKLGKMVRSFALDRAAVDTEKRTVRVQFSSEQPVSRWFGDEILDHSTGSVDLSRASAGCAVLLEHDSAQRVGITESATITANKTGEAVIRFSKSAKGEEAFQEVQDGTLRWISVGYRISRMKQEGDVDPKNPDDLAVYRATSWEPLEISLVAIPADTSARVIGRGENSEERDVTIENLTQRKIMSEPVTPPVAPVAPVAPIVAPAIVRSEAELGKEWQARAKEIMAIGDQFKRTKEASDAIIAGKTVDQFRKETLDALKAGQDAPEITSQRSGAGNKSVGEMLIDSPAYKSFVSGSGQRSVSISLPVGFSSRATATTTGLTSIQKQDGIVLVEQQPLTIGAIIPQTATDAITIRYIKEASYTQAATAVAEEGQKPEATFALEEVDATVRKIAVVGRVTDEFFADYNATRDYINNRMRYMVQSLEDNHLLNGTGNTNQIKGLLNFTGIQTQAKGADTAFDALHKAITKVRSVGFFEPDAVVMHPNDYQDYKLAKDGNLNYYGASPFAGGMTANIWGLPVVVTTAIAEGTLLVGAFRIGSQIFRKQGLTIETTNSDASDFQYNRIAIRAETRLTLACYRPLAFCTVTGL